MRQKLALGIQDFRKVRENNFYYVDKTRMIGEFLRYSSEVTLVTRPRRFGKTINMSMMAEFFDMTKDSKEIFSGLAVMDSEYADHINDYPVVFLTFKDAKGGRDTLVKFLKMELFREYQRYDYIFNDLNAYESVRYNLIYHSLMDLTAVDLSGVNDAIGFLVERLYKNYGRKVLLFIDEYDTPFLEAHVGGYYTAVRDDLSSLLRTALKGNEFLEMAMLTGIQRVAKENIFSGLNNLLVCTVKDPEYSDCFGFTKEETADLLKNFGQELSTEVRAMYDGYHFFDTDVYNPWSIVNYAHRKILQPYWVNTSENRMIRSAMESCDRSFFNNYDKLIERNEIMVALKVETPFFEVPGPPSLWGLLLNAGMITIDRMISTDFYQIRIPNREVKMAFIELTEGYLKLADGAFTGMFGSLLNGDVESFIEQYRAILLELPSYYDLKDENSYHMMMLGMCVCLSDKYEISSNREYGQGRSDIRLCAYISGYPDIILEFKYTKEESVDLVSLANKALNQIKAGKYTTGLKSKDTLCIGLAHRGKIAEVVWSRN